MLNKAKVPPQSNTVLQGDTTSIIDLFDTASPEERIFSEFIDDLVQKFLTTTEIHSAISGDRLNEMFRGSVVAPTPLSVAEYLSKLDTTIVEHSIHTSSPRCIGHMTSSLPYFMRPLAKLLVAMNQNMLKADAALALNHCERQVLAMLHHLLFQNPDTFYDQHMQCRDSTLGMITSGGTLSNISALWCARNACLGGNDTFPGVEKAGLSAALSYYGYRDAVIIGSTAMHYSFAKAAEILGIGTLNLLQVPADRHDHLDMQALRHLVEDCRARKRLIIALVGIAGTTNHGSIDPLAEIAELAQEFGIHFHVDAAWGGPLLFSRQHCQKVVGIERADTVTIDGHKQMYAPLGTGIVLFRDPLLARSIEKHAWYTIRPDSSDAGRRTIEGSRSGTALFLHAALNLIGHSGYEALIDHNIANAQYMAHVLRTHKEFELLAQPQTNIVVYRYIPEAYRPSLGVVPVNHDHCQEINMFNRRLHELQYEAGHTFVSYTVTTSTRYGIDRPVTALRAVLSNPLITQADIDAVLDEQCRIAHSLAKKAV